MDEREKKKKKVIIAVFVIFTLLAYTIRFYPSEKRVLEMAEKSFEKRYPGYDAYNLEIDNKNDYWHIKFDYAYGYSPQPYKYCMAINPINGNLGYVGPCPKENSNSSKNS